MRYISIFSGIEAASIAAQPLGWEPLAFAEIDPFPSAVLAERFPEVPNLGDVTKIDWGEFVEHYGRPDVLVGGSPCQSFSVAGGRESLAGESRLMFEYIRAVTEVRPRWFVWENVPGCLNTKDNAFSQLLTEMERGGYQDLAWRVLDAQFCRVPLRDDSGAIVGWFGPVAQRRRRVFLVGHIGEGYRAAAVLFEPESVRGDNPSSREKRKELTAALGRGSASENGYALQGDGGTSLNGNGGGTPLTGAPTLSTPLTDTALPSPRTSEAKSDWRGFDGTRAGALAANPDFNKGQGASLICMASGQANAEISGGGDPSPALVARQYKDPPFLVHQTGKTYSRRSARQTGTSSLSTINQSTEGDLSSPDGSTFDPPILIDRAAFNQGVNAKYPPTSK